MGVESKGKNFGSVHDGDNTATQPIDPKTISQQANAAQASAQSKSRRKSSTAFRTISEVADDLDVQQHVLRFWETKFSQVKPLKRGGGRRYYRPEDVALLQAIHHLLYTEGYTIKGVQKLLREAGKKQIVANFARGVSKDPALSRDAIDRACEEGQSTSEEPVQTQDQDERAMQGLNDEQREVLRSVLTELRDLRGMIKKRS